MAINERIEDMKTRTKTPIKKTAAGTAAGKMKLQSKAYLKADSLSSWKVLVGELLLLGNKDKKAFWPFFDVTLRQYIDLRLVSQDGSGRSGATN